MPRSRRPIRYRPEEVASMRDRQLRRVARAHIAGPDQDAVDGLNHLHASMNALREELTLPGGARLADVTTPLPVVPATKPMDCRICGRRFDAPLTATGRPVLCVRCVAAERMRRLKARVAPR